MAALSNPRHEQFAQNLALAAKYGWTNGSAYSRSGYRAEGRAAEANASRLLSDANNGIAARVQEIVGAGAKRAAVTVETLLNELDAVLAGAVGDKQFGAARAAIDSKARLKGLFIDRLEIGEAGAFAACKTPDEVVDALLADQPAADALAMLDVLRELIVARAAESAYVAGSQPALIQHWQRAMRPK